MFSFQATSMASGTAFYRDPATRLADAVQRARAMMLFERGEWPIGISKHVDAAFGTDEDGEVGGAGRGLGSGFCSV